MSTISRDVEVLEDRTLLAVGPLNYGMASATDITVRLLEQESTTLVQILDNSQETATVLVEQDLTDTSLISITGTSGDDTVVIDTSLLTVTNSLTSVSFDGGAGTNDTFVGPDGAVSWQSTGTKSGTAGILSFSNVEFINGGSGADSLAGTSSADTWAIAADSTVGLSGTAFSGIEILSGGTTDTLDYSASSDGVVVDLDAGEASGFVGVSGFRAIIGSNHDDLLIGNSNANSIAGGLGDDSIGGGPGTDTLTAGAGVDTLVERLDANLTLTDSTLTDGTSTNTLSGFELADLTGGPSPTDRRVLRSTSPLPRR